MELIRGKFGYKKNLLNKDTIIIYAIISFFVVLSGIFLITSNNDWSQFDVDKLLLIISNIFRVDKVGFETWTEIISGLLNSLLITAVITILSLLVAFTFAIFSTNTIFDKKITNTIKLISSIIRSVPTVVWIIILIPIFGLSISTAIIGMSLHSISFFIKSFSETFEEVDEDTIEALRAVGSSKLKIIFGAIIPSSLVKMIGWITLRFEINLAVVIVIAPVVGISSNIGFLIYSYNRSLNYEALGVSLALIIIVTILIDKLSSKIRNNIKEVSI